MELAYSMAITIKLPGSRSRDMMSETKALPERKFWLHWSHFVGKTVPQVSACDRKCTMDDGDDSRWPNDKTIGWRRAAHRQLWWNQQEGSEESKPDEVGHSTSECRDVKRLTRQLRRVRSAVVRCAVTYCSLAETLPAPATKTSLTADLLNQKRSSCWQT